MAISANELRIGNLVYNTCNGNNNLCPVEQILDKAVIVHYAHNTMELFHSDKYLQPIPLTPEILLKCGFVNVRDVHWRVPNSDASKSFEICVWSDHVSYTMANNFHLVIQSLHQLQNLYHSLTGQELKINL